MIGESFTLDIDGDGLVADLGVPERSPQGLVVFAHGSGSGRASPRNRTVAQALVNAGLATLLFDLLTPAEAATDASTGAFRFDIGLLGRRLLGVLDRMKRDMRMGGLPFGVFGASTGAAAALLAGAERPDLVDAVVARGGRPDLSTPLLARVRAPTLLIVGGRDLDILRVNQESLPLLPHPSRLLLVPGAGHLFEEPGALAAVGRSASTWFHRYLMPHQRDTAVASEGR